MIFFITSFAFLIAMQLEKLQVLDFQGEDLASKIEDILLATLSGEPDTQNEVTIVAFAII